MILRQFLHTEPAVAISYLFGCGGKQAGAVVDPVEAPDFYLAVAEAAGLRIKHVIDTHLHADHLSTGRSLAGAAYVLHHQSGAAFPFDGVRDGDRIALGNVIAEVWHTAGHTPEHISLLVTDRTRGADPWLIFTGHTLMVGDMGRTELASSVADGAQALFESAQRIRGLADYVQVLPGAFAGSVCGRGLSSTPVSTVGFEKRYNRAFAIEDRATFVDVMMRDIPPRPPAADEYRGANLGLAIRPATPTIAASG